MHAVPVQPKHGGLVCSQRLLGRSSLQVGSRYAQHSACQHPASVVQVQAYVSMR